MFTAGGTIVATKVGYECDAVACYIQAMSQLNTPFELVTSMQCVGVLSLILLYKISTL